MIFYYRYVNDQRQKLPGHEFSGFLPCFFKKPFIIHQFYDTIYSLKNHARREKTWRRYRR